MNKAFEKILERLEEKLRKSEERYHRYLDDSNLSCMFDRSDIEEKRVDTIKEMLEIVQEVAEEYKGGWIPCSEMLPNVETEVLIYTGDRGMTIASLTKPDIFWEDEQGNRLVDVIAWHPLPEPYKELE